MALSSNTKEQSSLKKTNNNEDLETIRRWLQTQPHLPQNLDDKFLLNFLRGCKYSLEIFKRKLDMYFSMRRHLPECFTNRDVSRPELQAILSYGYIITLPTMTPKGNMVYILGTTTTNFETPDFRDFCKVLWMVHDLRLHNEDVVNTGDVYVINASACLPKHFFKFSPTTLRKLGIYGFKSYPIVIKEVHFVNFHPFVTRIVNFVKPFLNAKILKRIHFHKGLESLHKHVPRDMLPEEYGGTAGKLDDYRVETVEKLKQHTDWFKQQETVIFDEAKRPVRKSRSGLFGVKSSFRELTID